jgi:hypothetical protein
MATVVWFRYIGHQGNAIGWGDDEVSWYKIASADNTLRSRGHAVFVTAVLGETLKYWAGVVTD